MPTLTSPSSSIGQNSGVDPRALEEIKKILSDIARRKDAVVSFDQALIEAIKEIDEKKSQLALSALSKEAVLGELQKQKDFFDIEKARAKLEKSLQAQSARPSQSADQQQNIANAGNQIAPTRGRLGAGKEKERTSNNSKDIFERQDPIDAQRKLAEQGSSIQDVRSGLVSSSQFVDPHIGHNQEEVFVSEQKDQSAQSTTQSIGGLPATTVDPNLPTNDRSTGDEATAGEIGAFADQGSKDNVGGDTKGEENQNLDVIGVGESTHEGGGTKEQDQKNTSEKNGEVSKNQDNLENRNRGSDQQPKQESNQREEQEIAEGTGNQNSETANNKNQKEKGGDENDEVSEVNPAFKTPQLRVNAPSENPQQLAPRQQLPSIESQPVGGSIEREDGLGQKTQFSPLERAKSSKLTVLPPVGGVVAKQTANPSVSGKGGAGDAVSTQQEQKKSPLEGFQNPNAKPADTLPELKKLSQEQVKKIIIRSVAGWLVPLLLWIMAIIMVLVVVVMAPVGGAVAVYCTPVHSIKLVLDLTLPKEIKDFLNQTCGVDNCGDSTAGIGSSSSGSLPICLAKELEGKSDNDTVLMWRGNAGVLSQIPIRVGLIREIIANAPDSETAAFVISVAPTESNVSNPWTVVGGSNGRFYGIAQVGTHPDPARDEMYQWSKRAFGTPISKSEFLSNRKKQMRVIQEGLKEKRGFYDAGISPRDCPDGYRAPPPGPKSQSYESAYAWLTLCGVDGAGTPSDIYATAADRNNKIATCQNTSANLFNTNNDTFAKQMSIEEATALRGNGVSVVYVQKIINHITESYYEYKHFGLKVVQVASTSVNLFGDLNIYAQSRPNTYSSLSKNHKEFLDYIAKEKGYIKYQDAGKADPQALKAFESLKQQAIKDGIPDLIIASGYRSYDDQVGTYFSKISKLYNDQTPIPGGVPKEVVDEYLKRAELSAPPGYSEHSTGLGFDFVAPNTYPRSVNLDPQTFETSFASWLATNAPKYGFKLSYPPGSNKGANYEPWHFAYEGVPNSKEFAKPAKTLSDLTDTNSTSGVSASTSDPCEVSGGSGSSTPGQIIATGDGTLINPAKGFVVTSEFNPARVHPVTGQVRPHNGIDIGTLQGTPIASAAEGKVVLAGEVSGYGGFIEIDHGNGLKTAYAHMSKIDVKVGQRVKKGEQIGLSGGEPNTPGAGTSTGAHLHFEVIKNGVFQNPRNYINF